MSLLSESNQRHQHYKCCTLPAELRRQFLAVYEGIEPSSLPRQDSILANERIDHFFLAVRTRLELATPCVTDMYSNQLNYRTKITSLSWSSPLTHRYYPYRSKAWLAPIVRLQIVVISVFYFLKTCGASPHKNIQHYWEEVCRAPVFPWPGVLVVQTKRIHC